MDQETKEALIYLFAFGIYILVIFVILGIPILAMLTRIGRTKTWIFSLFIPYVGLVVLLWLIAFTRWPKFEPIPTASTGTGKLLRASHEERKAENKVIFSIDFEMIDIVVTFGSLFIIIALIIAAIVLL